MEQVIIKTESTNTVLNVHDENEIDIEPIDIEKTMDLSNVVITNE